MVARFEHAWEIAAGTIPFIEYSPVEWQEVIDFIGTDGLAVYILGRWPTESTSAALRKAAARGASARLLAALVLASPEFQLQ